MLLRIAIVVVLAAVAIGVFMYLPENTETVLSPTNPASPVRADIAVIADNLEVPWDIAFLPDARMLVTERTGDVLLIQTEGTSSRKTIFSHPEQSGEGGLLGITLHPNFPFNTYVYLYMTAPGAGGEMSNRVIRYKFENDELRQDKIIVAGIPGAVYHDGGRMGFGPDGKLYITTGDATRPQIAQDTRSLGGKILRLNDDGSIPEDNPLGNAVYSYGHRNPQGLAWDSAGNLWMTEHGPTGERGRCCHDELNLVVKGGNFGWPTAIGDETAAGVLSPKRHSGTDVWAPAGLAYFDGSLYFGGLRGEALYEAVLEGDKVVELKDHFKGEYGRIRTVRVGPDNFLYMATSNTDTRGDAASDDDKIIRINPSILK